jgi:hypothetical protein
LLPLFLVDKRSLLLSDGNALSLSLSLNSHFLFTFSLFPFSGFSRPTISGLGIWTMPPRSCPLSRLESGHLTLSRNFFCCLGHNASNRHMNNVAKASAGVVKKHYCAVCQYACVKPSHLEMHNRGKRHLERVAAAESGGKST